ncbi:MAG: NAD(P)H-dependent oxidoreductase subunit E [Holdemania massiliensis]
MEKLLRRPAYQSRGVWCCYFYTQFTTEPKGKHVINVCMGTACYVKGSADLLQRICDLTGTKVNQTSADGLFSLDATRCLGACGLAPVAILDDQVYGNATSSTALEDRIKAIIKTESGIH